VLAVAAMGTFPAASFYLVCATLPAYLSDVTGVAPHVALGVHLANLFVLTLVIPLGGWMADGVGRTTTLLTSAAVTGALAYPVWMLVGVGLPAVAWLGQLLLVVGFGLFQGALAESAVMALPKGVSGGPKGVCSCRHAVCTCVCDGEG
jgi:MHS family proline/betaine transporter-like MFS transporter